MENLNYNSFLSLNLILIKLFKKPLEIGFLYNAHLINFNESQLVENFFKGINYVTITVNDIGDLIGAKNEKII